jgi:hypothetical protein
VNTGAAHQAVALVQLTLRAKSTKSPLSTRSLGVFEFRSPRRARAKLPIASHSYANRCQQELVARRTGAVAQPF